MGGGLVMVMFQATGFGCDVPQPAIRSEVARRRDAARTGWDRFKFIGIKGFVLPPKSVGRSGPGQAPIKPDTNR